ncbi:MAG: hypothetical protein ACMUIP_06955 [bacterium]
MINEEYRIFWPDATDYKEQINAFIVKPDAALSYARHEGAKRGKEVMWPAPLLIIDNFYFFGVPTKVNFPLKGFLVNGTTGKVISIDTDLIIRSNQKVISRDYIKEAYQ